MHLLKAQERNTSTPNQSQKHAFTYSQLKQYEGKYEYLNNTTLLVAASPKDTTLYAIINESKYKLTAIANDLFEDMTKNKVQFFRNNSKKVVGYIVGNDTMKIISSTIQFPPEMWYPRLMTGNQATYVYKQPQSIQDGLQTGNISHSGIDHKLLEEMMIKIIDGQFPDVHSILIAKDNQLVFEEYFYEHNRDKLHELRSVTKSFISALTGIAIDRGYIKSVHETVLPYFPEYSILNIEGKKLITIEHLLTNQSGLDCDISNPNTKGNETVMGNTNDWVKFTLDLPMIDTPGGKGMYCSGNPITLGRIIEKSSKSSLPNFAAQHLFSPLGIKTFQWHFVPDKSSAETFCQLYLSSRDMLKFGLLYGNNGRWNGKQVVPSSWVSQSLSKHSTVQGVNYGYLWWNKYLDADGTRYYTYGAQGNGGQKIYIFQELNMVIVITGGNYNTQSPSDELIKKYILPSFSKKN